MSLSATLHKKTLPILTLRTPLILSGILHLKQIKYTFNISNKINFISLKWIVIPITSILYFSSLPDLWSYNCPNQTTVSTYPNLHQILPFGFALATINPCDWTCFSHSIPTPYLNSLSQSITPIHYYMDIFKCLYVTRSTSKGLRIRETMQQRQRQICRITSVQIGKIQSQRGERL